LKKINAKKLLRLWAWSFGTTPLTKIFAELFLKSDRFLSLALPCLALLTSGSLDVAPISHIEG